jgi:serine/threonine protein kinase
MADLGLSCQLAHYWHATVHVPVWQWAPEVVYGGPYDPRADVWSFGLMISEVVNRCFEYGNPLHEYYAADSEAFFGWLRNLLESIQPAHKVGTNGPPVARLRASSRPTVGSNESSQQYYTALPSEGTVVLVLSPAEELQRVWDERVSFPADTPPELRVDLARFLRWCCRWRADERCTMAYLAETMQKWLRE